MEPAWHTQTVSATLRFCVIALHRHARLWERIAALQTTIVGETPLHAEHAQRTRILRATLRTRHATALHQLAVH